MSLQVVGKINMQDCNCVKCSASMYIKARSDKLKCNNCGALYSLDNSELCDQHLEFDYNFEGFECLYEDYLDGSCGEICPAMKMYCKEHSGEKFQNMAKNNITYAEKKLEEAKNKLDNINESRRTWLIQEVSGLDEDDSIQTNKDGQDPTVDDLGGAEGE
jgi:hypothetical protein